MRKRERSKALMSGHDEDLRHGTTQLCIFKSMGQGQIVFLKFTLSAIDILKQAYVYTAEPCF